MNKQPKPQGIPTETITKNGYNTNKTANKTELLDLKAGTHKRAQQSSFLALTSFQFSIASLLTKALLITVQ